MKLSLNRMKLKIKVLICSIVNSCKGKVFEAEKVPTKHGLFHKYCLSCNECHCNLDASTFHSAQDSEVSPLMS